MRQLLVLTVANRTDDVHEIRRLKFEAYRVAIRCEVFVFVCLLCRRFRLHFFFFFFLVP
jgi:hypothetical protein